MVALLAALLALLPAAGASAQSSGFSDVPDGYVHAEAISAIAARGITEGCTSGRYCPNEDVTRGQMASFLARALGLDAVADGPFTDVAGSEHEGSINALAAEGITEGCTPDRFCPLRAVSRQEMASFLTRAFGLEYDGTQRFFDDGGTHSTSVEAVGAEGVSGGCDPLGLEFCPTRSVTRGQMASFLGRSLDLVPRTQVPMLLEPGDEGSTVAALQRELSRHHYWIGPIDGVYGELTEHAVLALQKVHGLGRDGVYGPNTRAVLADPSDPQPRSTSGEVAEFDEDRQIVMLVDDGRVEHIFHASGGDHEPYTYEGQTYDAQTPNGEHRIYREIDGVRVSHLGELYRPRYFHRAGIAFHGYPDVPPTAASHGCVRLSNAAMDWVWATDAMPIGLPVLVYGSPV